jgi:hypothetical protein
MQVSFASGEIAGNRAEGAALRKLTNIQHFLSLFKHPKGSLATSSKAFLNIRTKSRWDNSVNCAEPPAASSFL